jgi:hypothetical protein
MRGGSNMKRAIITGVIAGFASGIVMFFISISGIYELFSVLPVLLPVDIQTLAIYNIIYGILTGIVWGMFYAFFYDYIPGKGVNKGLVYGLIIWIISPIHNVGAMAMYGLHMWAFPYAIVSFCSIGIVYGLVLGILYKKE